jgi:RNA polymerase sigma factor (sigma-70 family)
MRTDFELLDAWRAGCSAAGEALFERHFAAVCRFFRSKLDADVDDLVQSTFLACLEHRDQFRKKSSFRTYLLAIARYELLAHLRRHRSPGKPIEASNDSMADLEPSPRALIIATEEQDLLLQALKSIPLDLQIVVELYYWEEMTSREIAEVLDIPEGTARSRLRRAREALCAALRGSGG